MYRATDAWRSRLFYRTRINRMDKQPISLVTQQWPGLQEGIGGCGKCASTASTPDTNPKIADKRIQASPCGLPRRGHSGLVRMPLEQDNSIPA